MTKVRVTVPATTLNLGPGLDCMALALELYNTIELAEIEHGLHLDIGEEIVSGETESCARLVRRAASGIFHKAGYLPGGLHVRLENRIPPGDGLGGDVASLLGGAIAANILLGSPFTREEVLQVVLGIKHQPHALLAAHLGGLVICSAHDADLTYAPVRIAPMRVAVVLPRATAGDAAIALPQQVSLEDAIFNVAHAALVVQALASGSFALLRHAMQDRLHEAARGQAIAGCQEMIEAAHKSGAAAVVISGAGLALVAFAQRDHDQIAGAMAHAYQSATGAEALTWVLPVDAQGISISEIGTAATERPVPASSHPVEANRQPDGAGGFCVYPGTRYLAFIPRHGGQTP